MARVVGYTAGVFDMFDIGHLNILRSASRNCDYLIVAVTTDELAEQKNGRRPIVPFMERMEIVQNVRWVDDVVPQVTMETMEAWHNLKFDVMFAGDDLKGTDVGNSLERQFADVGVRVVYFPYAVNTSNRTHRMRLFAE